jgi:hypothetical protein
MKPDTLFEVIIFKITPFNKNDMNGVDFNDKKFLIKNFSSQTESSKLTFYLKTIINIQDTFNLDDNLYKDRFLLKENLSNIPNLPYVCSLICNDKYIGHTYFWKIGTSLINIHNFRFLNYEFENENIYIMINSIKVFSLTEINEDDKLKFYRVIEPKKELKNILINCGFSFQGGFKINGKKLFGLLNNTSLGNLPFLGNRDYRNHDYIKVLSSMLDCKSKKYILTII